MSVSLFANRMCSSPRELLQEHRMQQEHSNPRWHTGIVLQPPSGCSSAILHLRSLPKP